LLSNFDFSQHFRSPEGLAKQVLQVFYCSKDITYPIDPFKLLKDFGIIFQMRNFDKLEGIYIVPEDENDIPIVGINNNRPITRQRFTAAHEICHHIKDKADAYCPITGPKNDVEKFADKFAAALLMPIEEMMSVSDRYLVNGFVDLDGALLIADYFGVSFEACVFRLAYDMHRISGDTSLSTLQKRIQAYKPQFKRISQGLEKHDLSLLRNIIQSYELLFPQETSIVWNKFKIDFVFNENRLEGLEIEHDKVGEIVTDLRLKKQESPFCRSEFKTIIEVCGHSAIYDHIFSTEDKISAFSLLRLNQLLYQFSPFPEAAGRFRQTNNIVLGSNFETSDYHDIITQITAVDKNVKGIVTDIKNISLTDYIDNVVQIHHRMTVIHPFPDGNGRVTRAFLNWMFRLKGLPPVYLKYENKQKYFDALSIADRLGNYDPLIEIFYREILRSMYELNTKFSL
jgi:Zn-dependent peptidase ImmA (M78 family)/fido (protein-threonine AMPylation protein)